jgi:hypothetical protein
MKEAPFGGFVWSLRDGIDKQQRDERAGSGLLYLGGEH